MQKVSDKLLEEYKNICEAGFQGTLDDYIYYKENYGKDISTKNFYKKIQEIDDENILF